MKFTFFYAIISVLALQLSNIFSVSAQDISAHRLDSLAKRAMHVFNVPGIAVTIVKDGRVVYANGYGLRSLRGNLKVDGNTLFGIASNSKAFTAAALGILVDEGKLKWDDKLTEYIPEFKMYDPCVTPQFTIRDMLCHRSGLGLGAGDLLHNPDSSNFTIKDIINSLHYLKPQASFRSRYAYDNIFYLIAAEVVSRVSGISWQDFIKSRIMQPIGMTSSNASYKRVKDNSNIIDGYKEVGSKLAAISRSDAETDAGAGGIYASAADMGQWMLVQLNEGKYGKDLSKRLFSDSVHKEMWAPQIFIPTSKYGAYNTHFGAYRLGWFLNDVKGYENVSHTGQDDGMISEVSLIPDLKFGVTVLSNQEGGGAVRAIIDQIVDDYIGVSGIDRIEQWSKKVKANSGSGRHVDDAIWNKVRVNSADKNASVNNGRYQGIYHDNWLGKVQVSEKNGKLWFQSERSPQLRGEMNFFDNNVFVVRWTNPQINADAFVSFTMNLNGTAKGFTMKRASPETSVAFDFQDLDFIKITSK